jgi:TetR/AcrR family transcriptional repressor of multidrug resistance operon
MRTRDINKEQMVKQKAIETIVKYGLEGFTINKLAKACGISVGTPYVYYKDKDDLIVKIVMEEGARMEEAMLRNFDPEASLEDGLRIQWQNRFDYMIENPLLGQFFDQINSSTYQEQFLQLFNGEVGGLMSKFKQDITAFLNNVVKRGEMDEMPFEVYWSVAYSPLYSLLRFHQRGQSVGGKPFKITDRILWAAFDRVVKALKN